MANNRLRLVGIALIAAFGLSHVWLAAEYSVIWLPFAVFWSALAIWLFRRRRRI